MSDDQLAKLKRGGHDPEKVYAAYKAAVDFRGAPTVILAATVKGYGLGEAGEGMNITHQQKKLKARHLLEFRNRFALPLSDDDVEQAHFYKSPADSAEMAYLQARRKELGGPVPSRRVRCAALKPPGPEFVEPYAKGSGDKEFSTTIAAVNVFERLMRDRENGKWFVPIIPDEARTFGMDPWFQTFKIYSSVGQRYTPVDDRMTLAYREAKQGQILEEGITEAGSMSSFIAAGTAYATHGVPTVPFYIYYSMFGFQRVGDLIWAAADMRVRGFLLGATAGRTTLNGEGLQHEDGHSHLLAASVPNLLCYDPAYAYELAVIVREGVRRMYGDAEYRDDVFYYITLYNENYVMRAMPKDCGEGILKGLYKLQPSTVHAKGAKAHLLGSGPILPQALHAQELLAEVGVAADVWSATSYKELRRECLAAERWNMLHPFDTPRESYLQRLLASEAGDKTVFVAASDFMKAVPEMIQRWVPGGLYALGTDGFGRSDTRAALRRHFEVDAECIALAAMVQLHRRGAVKEAAVRKGMEKWKVDAEKINPNVA